MAIYHLRATKISRSAGRSSTAAAAYRAAARIEDHRTGVDHVEILAPRGRGLTYAGATQVGPALEAGRQTAREAGRDEPSADPAQDLASSLRSAWEARQNQHARSAPEVAPQPDASRSLADRLREAAKGVDPGAYADRAVKYQKNRIEEDRPRALDDERTKDQQRQQTHERTWDRDDGHEL